LLLMQLLTEVIDHLLIGPEIHWPAPLLNRLHRRGRDPFSRAIGAWIAHSTGCDQCRAVSKIASSERR
jgi:hypothetical protein